MNFLKKVLNTFHCCLHLIKAKWQHGKCLFAMEILLGLIQESKAVVLMVFPAITIQMIMDITNVDKVLLFVFLITATLSLVSILMDILKRSLSNHSNRALNYLILKLNNHAMNISYAEFERNETIEKFDKAYDGLWNSSDVDFYIFTVIISKLVSFGITTYIFTRVHWLVAIIVVSSLLIEFIMTTRLNERLHDKDQEISTFISKKNYISDVMFDCRSNKDIFIYGAKGFFVEKHKKISHSVMQLEKEKRDLTYTYDTIAALIEFFRTGIIYAVAVSQYMGGGLPLANFTLFASAAKQMTYSIWQILQGCIQLFRSSDYYSDFLKYIEIEGHNQSERNLNNEKIESLEFRNVFFRYPNQNTYAVKELSFKITIGETIAFVGDNGAGKSTVIKLLMRLYPVTRGEILLNGKSIYEYDIKEYMSYFAPVFQDYMLYSFSVRENLAFDKLIDTESLKTILNEVGLGEKINSLPKGIDTPYTKRFDSEGVEFSGGEEQKLILGRALAHDGQIMILDEPTAALDPLAEYEIYDLIYKLRKEHTTTIFVSHRLSTTRLCDRVFVFDQGCLVEIGNHNQLMNTRGLYRNMFEMQKQYYFKKDKGVIDEAHCSD